MVVALLVAALGGAIFVMRYPVITGARPFDFDINWVAARRLVDGAPLYAAHSSRVEAISLVGPFMRNAFRSPYSSYIGAPVVALVHTPFLAPAHDDAVAIFRVVAWIGSVVAVGVAALTLPARSRLPGGLIGIGALLMSWSLASTLSMGQANELVMLAYAFALVGVARQKWPMVGIALGVASVLKLAPVFLVLYLVVRGRRSVLGWAVGSAGAVSVAAAAVGRPSDTWTWLRDVLPGASHGTLYFGNQSLTGWIGRLVSPVTELTSNWDLGSIRYVSWIFIVGCGLALWRLTRRHAVQPLELGLGMLVVLLAGPLSWDHYFVWAFVPLVVLLDPAVWRRSGIREQCAWCAGLTTAVVLLAIRPTMPSAVEVAADPLTRLYTSPSSLAVLILVVVAFRQVAVATAGARDVVSTGHEGSQRHALVPA